MTSPSNWYSIKGYRNISRWNMNWVKNVEHILPKIKLQAGIHPIIAEVASTKNNRQYGLMSRKQIPENYGMLFIFETLQKYCFWMKNTHLPLSIAFLRDDGTIINIADMQPYSLYKHCANEPVRYALEMNQGWFAKKNVNVGTRIINKQYFKNTH